MYRCIWCYIIFLSLLSNHVVLLVPIQCYNCANENSCRTLAYGLKVCSTQCCYEQAVYTRSRLTYTRGCYNGTDCTYDCRDADRVECTRCDTTGCNQHRLEAKKFYCYSCEDCYEVNSDTTIVECRGPECCYVALVRNTPKSSYSVYRGCIDWNPGLQCKTKTTRARVQITYYNLHVMGKIEQLIVGNATSKSTFNNDTYHNSCYSCTKCNVVSKNTQIVPCGIHKFCYTIYVTEHEQTFANRGCSNYNNLDYACRQLEEEYKAKDKKGDFEECIFCDFPVLCNGGTFTKNAVIQMIRPAVICYKCDNCNILTAETKTIKCLQDTCCYRAAVRTDTVSPYSAKRGCFRPNVGESCEHTCKFIKKNFKAKFPNGTIDSCVPCISGDEDNCNYNKYTFPAPKRKGNDPIMCYNCTNCSVVNSVTSNIVCDDPSCCYSAKIKTDSGDKQVVRRCSDNCTHPCKTDYDINNIYSCSPCSKATHGCNGAPYVVSITQTVKAASISCYACHNCSQVTYYSGVVECTNPRCCYKALLEINPIAPLYVVRGCAELMPGQKCENTCTYLERKHKQNYKRGRLHMCAQCKVTDRDGCNNRTYDLNQIERRYHPVKCYDCEDCDVVTAETNLINCREPHCCYSAYLRDTDTSEFYTIRGCARWRRGLSCAVTCAQLHNEHLWEYPNGMLKKCLPCRKNDTDYCNKYTIYPRKFLPSQTPLIAMNCYDCTNCDNITAYTLVIRCPGAACCYTAYLKNRVYDFRVRVARGCMEPNENDSCARTCAAVGKEHLWANPQGTFVRCIACKDNEEDECNNEGYTFEKGPEGNKFIVCYNCKENCDKITYRTPTIRCPLYYSCYIALVTKKPNTTMYAIRGCEKSCKKVESKHPNSTFHYCMTCKEDKRSGCNKNPYNPIKPKKRPTVCYNCRRCNSITTDTEKVTCPQPNCCYIAIVRDILKSNSFVIRGCIESCKDTCEYVRKDHQINYPNGTWSFCMTCERHAGINCNNNTFICPTNITEDPVPPPPRPIPPKDKKPSSVDSNAGDESGEKPSAGESPKKPGEDSKDDQKSKNQPEKDNQKSSTQTSTEQYSTTTEQFSTTTEQYSTTTQQYSTTTQQYSTTTQQYSTTTKLPVDAKQAIEKPPVEVDSDGKPLTSSTTQQPSTTTQGHQLIIADTSEGEQATGSPTDKGSTKSTRETWPYP